MATQAKAFVSIQDNSRLLPFSARPLCWIGNLSGLLSRGTACKWTLEGFAVRVRCRSKIKLPFGPCQEREINAWFSEVSRPQKCRASTVARRGSCLALSGELGHRQTHPLRKLSTEWWWVQKRSWVVGRVNRRRRGGSECRCHQSLPLEWAARFPWGRGPAPRCSGPRILRASLSFEELAQVLGSRSSSDRKWR